jgi:hypothetical protein
MSVLSADNERETRGKTKKEQRKNKEARRIFSLIIRAAESNESNALKERNWTNWTPKRINTYQH